jgi:hypothetical protein
VERWERDRESVRPAIAVALEAACRELGLAHHESEALRGLGE